MRRKTRNLSMLAGILALTLAGSGLVSPGTDPLAAATNGSEAQFTIRRTSGLFALPAGAASVDWMVANNGTQPQRIRVTVFRYGVNQPKTAVPPGPLTLTVNPGQATHNANSVGPGQPFVPGFYYEVVVESIVTSVHPSVQVWSNAGGTAIPGTLISPGVFVTM